LRGQARLRPLARQAARIIPPLLLAPLVKVLAASQIAGSTFPDLQHRKRRLLE